MKLTVDICNASMKKKFKNLCCKLQQLTSVLVFRVIALHYRSESSEMPNAFLML